MRNDLYPLLFTPVYKSYLWGGSRLAAFYGRQGTPDVCAESWEVSDRAEGMSVVRNGPLAGRTLTSLVMDIGRPVIGAKAPPTGRFPLLIKLIDARQRLSVQVHPYHETAYRYGGESKTEAWVMLADAPGACVYCGWREPMTEARFRALLAQGELAHALGRIEAKPGTAVYVPGGRVHAIGEGCLIFEVQQNSNTTYRVDDWNRVDDDGKPRELHVEQAVKVIDWDDTAVTARAPTRIRGGGENARWRLVSSPFFRLVRLDLAQTETVESDPSSFTCLFVQRGAAVCNAAGMDVPLTAGTSCLVPAALERYTLCPAAPSTSLVVTRLGR